MRINPRQDYQKNVNPGWKKVLYEAQIYSDNYIPPTFLQGLCKNDNLRYYSLKESMIYSGLLTQVINFTIIFLQVFNLLQSSYRSTLTCFYIGVYIGIVSLLLHTTLLLSSKSGDVIGELKTGIILIVSGFAVSPILKTLTETISTDTV